MEAETVALFPLVTVLEILAFAEVMFPSPSFLTVTVVLVVGEDCGMTDFSVTEVTAPVASVFVVVVTATSLPFALVSDSFSVLVA